MSVPVGWALNTNNSLVYICACLFLSLFIHLLFCIFFCWLIYLFIVLSVCFQKVVDRRRKPDDEREFSFMVRF